MKKQLIIAFALCVLFLSACGTLVGTKTPTHSSTPPSVASIATASKQSVCHVLQERQVQLSQQYHVASMQFSAALTQGTSLQVGEAEMTLIRLHQLIVQTQAQTKAC